MRKSMAFLGVFFLLTACASTPHQDEELPPPAPPVVPEPVHEPEFVPLEIKEPAFIITSITILQADLINTSLKLSLRIDNSNPFPITLSSFRYELYGDGSFWTDGIIQNLAVVPAQGVTEASFDFAMNFIGMKRRLFDDILAMREVRYRVTGSMELGTDISSLPGIRVNFDSSGNSAVIQ